MSVELINQKIEQTGDPARVLELGHLIGNCAYAVRTNHVFRNVDYIRTKIARQYRFISDYYNNVVIWGPDGVTLENSCMICFKWST